MLSFHSSNNENKTKTVTRRMFLLTLAKSVVLLGIFGRLAALQINESQKYKTLSDKNRFREWRTAPPRGIIRDYFDKEIATNRKVYQLHITPENTAGIDNLFLRLKNILNLSDERIFFLKRKIAKQKPWEPIIVSDNLTWSEFSRINLFLHELQGVEPVVSIARQYPDKSTSHLIGYVSQVSPRDLQTKDYIRKMNVAGIAVGKNGLESQLDKEIIGKVGFQRYEVNAYGKRVKQHFIDKGSSGKSFKTTIDLEVQNHASSLMNKVSGSICVMDIYKGDIIAMVSSPTYDPNLFVHGINSKEWNYLLNHRDNPLVNKSISGLYPPGSTLKTLVALSALENDIVSTKKYVECKGFIELFGEKFHCWKKKGHGFMNMRTAIKRSCDVYFYEIVKKLGVDRLSKTTKKFGLGAKVLDGFPEERGGTVPSTKWKLSNLGKNWYLGETLHSGIGQGYYLTTPLQLCLMTAQIANGGYKIKPKVILGDDDLDIKQYLNNENKESKIKDMFNYNLQPLFRNQENINFIKEAMFASTNEPGGTSYRSRLKDKKNIFAGKTGSSQIKIFTEEQRKAEIKQKDIDYLSRDHALYIAFAPYHDPKYAISVIIEHGGSGSKAAAPIAKEVIKKVLERDKIRNSRHNSLGKEI